jgi:hypothetical protein
VTGVQTCALPISEIGDNTTRVRVDVDRAVASPLGLLTHRSAGGSVLCQLMLSALELDDTRKPSAHRPGARHFRFSVRGIRL